MKKAFVVFGVCAALMAVSFYVLYEPGCENNLYRTLHNSSCGWGYDVRV